jgi:8-oxo-dGTP pyrophosphatase MutT (NUDIX family)
LTKVIDKLAWLHLEDKKLLTARSLGKELFYIPGGKRESGESDQQALIREIKEEISVDIIEKSIKYAENFSAQADGKSEGVIVNLTCYYADYIGELTPDSEIAELRLLSSVDKSVCSKATVAAIDWLATQGLIE